MSGVNEVIEVDINGHPYKAYLDADERVFRVERLDQETRTGGTIVWERSSKKEPTGNAKVIIGVLEQR